MVVFVCGFYEKEIFFIGLLTMGDQKQKSHLIRFFCVN